MSNGNRLKPVSQAKVIIASPTEPAPSKVSDIEAFTNSAKRAIADKPAKSNNS